MRYAIGIVMVAALTGCASQSTNMREGTDTSYVSLKDQREAVKGVKEYPEVPPGAKIVGMVDAARCHSNTLNTPPKEADVILDLKIAAYARGADGITQVKIVKESGLLQNCWTILNGTATAFSLQ